MNSNSAEGITATITGEGWMAKHTGGRRYPTQDEIARLAFHHYEVNGRQDGHDIDDWLLAERELAHHYA